MSLSSVPFCDKAGNNTTAIVALNDITERKRTNEALPEQQVTHKLENVHCPESELGHPDLSDIIEVTALQALMDNFYKIAHIPMSIIDLKGKVLVGVGWQDICTKFHRAHPDTCRHCVESDTQLSRCIPPGEFRLYKCKNKMWDIATPIMVGDQHVGNVFSGQFFFDDELLDYDFFRSQARQYGFNEEEYISALEAAPCLSREAINTGITFLMQLADMISKLSYSNIKLVRSLEERDALMESLQKSEERLNLASMAAGIGVWSWTPGTSHLTVSANWRSLFGIPEEDEVTLETWRDALHPEDREYAVNELSAASEQHREMDVEYRVVSPDGTIRWIVDRGRALYDQMGRPVSMAGVNVDITERKRNEKSTRLSRLYSVLSKINEAIVRIREPQKLFEEACRVAVEDGQFRMVWIGLADPDTKLIKVVAKYGHDDGYLDSVRISVNKDTPEGRGPTGIALRKGGVYVNNDTENNPAMKPWRDEQLKRGYRASASFPFMIENQMIGTINLYANKTNYFDEEEIQLLQSLSDDVSFAIESADIERQLRQSEAQHRQIIEASPDAYFVFVQNRILYANPATLKLFGYKKTREIDITTLKNLIIPQKYKKLGILESQEPVHLGEITIAKEAGLPITVEGLVIPIMFEGETAYQYIIRDITQRKEFEKEMARLDRLNLIGEMAAGIGHEIRNPMTTVRGFLQILGEKGECAKHKEYFDLMIDELDRANSIITEFLKLAKNKTLDKRIINLNDEIKILLPLIQSDAMKSDKYIVLELEGIPDLLLDEKEIRQVIFNLVRNGLEASPTGSVLTIRTFSDGDDVVLAIQDSGKGISPDVLERIGTPFFTTKDNGTGLGLAVCYSIAARHNAKIEIETGLNGTTFFIRLERQGALETVI